MKVELKLYYLRTEGPANRKLDEVPAAIKRLCYLHTH